MIRQGKLFVFIILLAAILLPTGYCWGEVQEDRVITALMLSDVNAADNEVTTAVQGGVSQTMTGGLSFFYKVVLVLIVSLVFVVFHQAGIRD